MLKIVSIIVLLLTNNAFVVAQKAPSKQQQKKEIVTIGHMPGVTISTLPKPAYPAAAAAVRVSGTVRVAILIDENGNVEKAEIVSGPPLLCPAALNAALQAKFVPAKLSGKPVKARTEIQYHFGQVTVPENELTAPIDKLKPLTKIL
jgi:TonB family protein